VHEVLFLVPGPERRCRDHDWRDFGDGGLWCLVVAYCDDGDGCVRPPNVGVLNGYVCVRDDHGNAQYWYADADGHGCDPPHAHIHDCGRRHGRHEHGYAPDH